MNGDNNIKEYSVSEALLKFPHLNEYLPEVVLNDDNCILRIYQQSDGGIRIEAYSPIKE